MGADIRRDEVLRYLGRRGQEVDSATDELVDKAVALCARLARPRTVHRIFPLEREGAGIRLAGTGVVLTGEDAARRLAGAEACVLLAATVGVETESRIRTLEQRDLTASLVLDAAATAAVEAVCDGAEAQIQREAGERGLCPGPRFSPGYGDLPLALQPDILAALDAERRIGLTCTGSLILLPRKSVTAVVGLFEGPAAGDEKGCSGCNRREHCRFRREDREEK